LQDISSLSPEARAERGDRPARHRGLLRDLFPGGWWFTVLKRVIVGVFANGFAASGNLAYLALLTVFPFFILAAAIARLFGHNEETLEALGSFLQTLPPQVAALLRQPIHDVLLARTGNLLWLGAAVGLWTVASFVETIRDIFRRAYGVVATRSFWRYRLGSMAVIVGSVILVLLSFLAQGLLTATAEFVVRVFPVARSTASWIGVSRYIPGAIMYLALYVLFFSVTPAKYRASRCRKWPGALFTTVWWLSATALLPGVARNLGHYDLTYGSLAGVIVALLFFYIVGLGIVIGAHLNAALAEGASPGLEGSAMAEEREAVAA
jgi:membrane protein